MTLPLIKQLRSEQAMVQWMIELVAQARHSRPDEIDPDTPFVELGLDSMSAVSVSGDLEMTLGIDLSPTLLWEYPTIHELVPHLWQLWRDRQAERSVFAAEEALLAAV